MKINEQKISHVNMNYKKFGYAKLVLDKMDFVTKNSSRDRAIFMTIKRIYQEDITTTNAYVPNDS